MHTGEATEGADLDQDDWTNLVQGTNELARYLLEEFGIELVFHPHVDTHVDTQERIERFLSDTDPQYVNLCLDTGHIAYCHGDNVQIVERFPDRITYVHLKQVDPAVRDRVLAEKLPLSEAVKRGAMVEPPYGEPAMPPLLDALAKLDRDVFCVIEQDLYPVAPDVPLPIAARTAGYFAACGVGPTRRWPYRALERTDRDDTQRRRHRRRNDRPGPHPQAHARAVGGAGHRGDGRGPRPGEVGGRRPARREGVADRPGADRGLRGGRGRRRLVGPHPRGVRAGLHRGGQAGVLREAARHHPGGVRAHPRRRDRRREAPGHGGVHAPLRRRLPRHEGRAERRADRRPAPVLLRAPQPGGPAQRDHRRRARRHLRARHRHLALAVRRGGGRRRRCAARAEPGRGATCRTRCCCCSRCPTACWSTSRPR